MYYWNTKQLAQDLKAGRVSQRERMKYLLASEIVLTLIMGMQIVVRYEPWWLLWVELALLVVVTCVGIFMCFKANEKGDNKEFIDRFICIGWPVGIKVVLLGLVAGIVSVAVRASLFLPPPPADPTFPPSITTQGTGEIQRNIEVLEGKTQEIEAYMKVVDQFFSTYTIIDVAIVIFIIVLLYWRTFVHIKRIAGGAA